MYASIRFVKVSRDLYEVFCLDGIYLGDICAYRMQDNQVHWEFNYFVNSSDGGIWVGLNNLCSRSSAVDSDIEQLIADLINDQGAVDKHLVDMLGSMVQAKVPTFYSVVKDKFTYEEMNALHSALNPLTKNFKDSEYLDCVFYWGGGASYYYWLEVGRKYDILWSHKLRGNYDEYSI